MGQMFDNWKVIALTGAIVGFLGLIPGMPNLVFLLLASGLGWLAWSMYERSQRVEKTPVPVAPAPVQESQDASWNDVA